MITRPSEGAIPDAGAVRDAVHAGQHDPDAIWPGRVAASPHGWLADLAGHGHLDEVVNVPAKVLGHLLSWFVLMPQGSIIPGRSRMWPKPLA